MFFRDKSGQLVGMTNVIFVKVKSVFDTPCVPVEAPVEARLYPQQGSHIEVK